MCVKASSAFCVSLAFCAIAIVITRITLTRVRLRDDVVDTSAGETKKWTVRG